MKYVFVANPTFFYLDMNLSISQRNKFEVPLQKTRLVIDYIIFLETKFGCHDSNGYRHHDYQKSWTNFDKFCPGVMF